MCDSLKKTLKALIRYLNISRHRKAHYPINYIASSKLDIKRILFKISSQCPKINIHTLRILNHLLPQPLYTPEEELLLLILIMKSSRSLRKVERIKIFFLQNAFQRKPNYKK
eukprot:c22866_g1_i2 orf=1068-1403(+)